MKKSWLVMAFVVIAIVGFAAYQLLPSAVLPGGRKEFKLIAGAGKEYSFSDGGEENPTLRVKKGDVVKVTLRDKGMREHEFMIVEDVDRAIRQVEEGVGHPMAVFGAEVRVKPGIEDSVVFRADQAGNFFYVCLEKEPEVHAKRGMVGKFIVEK